MVTFLQSNRLREIHAKVPNTPLVMHGSSSVPKDLQDIINAHGGELKSTWGVPIEEIQKGIQYGVRKVNVDTDLRLAMTGAIRRVLSDTPSEFDPRRYLAPSIAAMKTVCRDRCAQFGAAGRGTGIRALPLSEMARSYGVV